MTAIPTPTQVVSLTDQGNRRILCAINFQDFHNLVLEEKEAVAACWKFAKEQADNAEMATSFELMVRRIEAWCRQSGVISECWAFFRRDDLMVVMIAKSEDGDGAIHGSMTDLEMAFFEAQNPFRLNFLLLRGKEARGLSAFVNTEKAWLVFRAE